MKILFTIFLVLSVALCVVFISSLKPEFFHGIEYDVRVINGFRNNSSLPLVIWCLSPNDDMGGRALQEGDDFSWSLKDKYFWATNDVVCTMKWDERRKKFDAFKVERDRDRCGILRKCSWLVREDGFYFSNDEVNWKKDFSWF